MNSVFLLLLTFSFWLTCLDTIGQCSSVSLADSSFEVGTLITGGFPYEQEIWYTDDGCELTSDYAYLGDTSACSNGGGAFQLIPVDSQTTYYLSCYVLNGVSDPYPALKINWATYPISPASDNWSFVSQSYHSGSDTVAIVGFYSAQACFDLFRLSCTPLVGIIADSYQSSPPYSIYPSISPNQFLVETTKPCTIEVLDLSGRTLERLESENGLKYFGQRLPASIYVVRIQSDKQVWLTKIIKI